MNKILKVIKNMLCNSEIFYICLHRQLSFRLIHEIHQNQAIDIQKTIYLIHRYCTMIRI